MKVTISSAGPFHAYDLARQMERLGLLNHLYTAYPKTRVHGIRPQRIHSSPWLMLPTIASGRMGWRKIQRELNWHAITTFDRWTAKHLTASDVFHSLSSFGLQSQRIAKEHFNALTICDRGASHILFQDEILDEEFARWGLPYKQIDRRIVDRELQEYDQCDVITVPSTFSYRSFIEKGVPEYKLAKVPYGVELTLFKPVKKDDKIFRVIYVGSMSFQKGIPYLLQAVESLGIPNIELWLIGGLTDEIKSVFAKYSGRFRYVGIVPRQELYQYYSQGSVFVIASIQDGFGMVQSQAMSCGLPVIATNNTGAEDLFTDGIEGFIVPIRNPEAIGEKILFLYEHPDVREEMAQAALRRVRSASGWNTYGERMAEIYRQALIGRSSPSIVGE